MVDRVGEERLDPTAHTEFEPTETSTSEEWNSDDQCLLLHTPPTQASSKNESNARPVAADYLSQNGNSAKLK